MEKNILLVEDETILGDIYKSKLESVGYNVIWALTAEEGLKKARKERIDLVLLDILLPKKSGIYFLSEMKKDNKIADITVLVFSNFDDPLTREKAFELGAKEYIIKTSFTAKELVNKVKEYLP